MDIHSVYCFDCVSPTVLIECRSIESKKRIALHPSCKHRNDEYKVITNNFEIYDDSDITFIMKSIL